VDENLDKNVKNALFFPNFSVENRAGGFSTAIYTPFPHRPVERINGGIPSDIWGQRRCTPLYTGILLEFLLSPLFHSPYY
jgi:hypothetical protein